MEKIIIPEEIEKDFIKARYEVGVKEYEERLDMVFGKPVLNYARTMVINLPGSCHANCSYCIDSCLRKNVIKPNDFLGVCEKAFREFPDIKELSITGGSLEAEDFNRLIGVIGKYYPEIVITWNTNGILINENYDVSKIKYINLHRNSINDDKNRNVFQSNKPIISISEAKMLFGDKLCLRITVDDDFNLDEYSSLGIPLYINKMLPGTASSDLRFENTLKKLNVSEKVDIRRRNRYLNCDYSGVSVRVCLGDALAERVSGRYPVFLNVVIIHRSGRICGSWYEDDKVIL